MLEIKVRKAEEHEKLIIGDEDQQLPKGVSAFDSTDWDTQLFMSLEDGDWVIEIADPDKILRWTNQGTYRIKMGEDGGFLFKVN
jgi:hypothetical protein